MDENYFFKTEKLKKKIPDFRGSHFACVSHTPPKVTVGPRVDSQVSDSQFEA